MIFCNCWLYKISLSLSYLALKNALLNILISCAINHPWRVCYLFLELPFSDNFHHIMSFHIVRTDHNVANCPPTQRSWNYPLSVHIPFGLNNLRCLFCNILFLFQEHLTWNYSGSYKISLGRHGGRQQLQVASFKLNWCMTALNRTNKSDGAGRYNVS